MERPGRLEADAHPGPLGFTRPFVVLATGIDALKFPLSALVKPLEVFFQVPVADETGLQGNFDFKVTWEGLTKQVAAN
jgi:uncharacterized protein (TIGR03435 family)